MKLSSSQLRVSRTTDGIECASLLPLGSSGLVGQKSLRTGTWSDNLITVAGVAADDGFVTPRRRPGTNKHGLSQLTVNAAGNSPRALTAGREANDNPSRAPRSFGAWRVVMRAMFFAACLLTAGACGLQQSDSTDQVTYHATADETGWAVAKLDGYTFGDMITVTAWEVREYCDGCDPVLWQLHEVGFMMDGSVCAEAPAGSAVVFIVKFVEENK